MNPQYDSIKSLKNLVLGRQMHFIIKIYHLLSYSKYHKDDISTIGIYWVNNEGIISVNSSILGNFVGIKPNTVNKNFKSYGILKEKISKSIKLDLNEFIDSSRWIYRKSKNYVFNANSSIEDVLKFRPKFDMSNVIASPFALSVHNNELKKDLRISSFSLLRNRNANWESMLKSKFADHWYEIAGSNNAVYIKDIITFLKNDQKEIFDVNPCIENKILEVLCFFSNSNNEIIDIDDYFVFSSFFGIGGAIAQNIKKLPFKNDEGMSISINETDSVYEWFKMIKYDQTLLMLMTNQLDDTWVLCFSNEPGIYLLLNKSDGCIFQTQIFFDAIDNLYYIGTSIEGVKKFYFLNDLIVSFLRFDVQNHLNIDENSNVINVPADLLHMNLPKMIDIDEIFQTDVGSCQSLFKTESFLQ